MADGLRVVGRGGGFLPIGGGGPLPLVLRKLLWPMGGGAGGRPGMGGAALPGGRGAAGGLGADRIDSPGSERYEDSEFAPVSTPPVLFFSFGIPPANKPPNCGAADSMPDGPVLPDPWSLLLLALFPGTGGAKPPGTGGAPPTGGPDEEDDFSIDGAERSFVTAFFRALPFVMSDNRAFYNRD